MAKSSGLTPLKVSKIIEPSNKYTLYGFFKKDLRKVFKIFRIKKYFLLNLDFNYI